MCAHSTDEGDIRFPTFWSDRKGGSNGTDDTCKLGNKCADIQYFGQVSAIQVRLDFWNTRSCSRRLHRESTGRGQEGREYMFSQLKVNIPLNAMKTPTADRNPCVSTRSQCITDTPPRRVACGRESEWLVKGESTPTCRETTKIRASVRANVYNFDGGRGGGQHQRAHWRKHSERMRE